MGLSFSKLWDRLFGKEEVRVTMIGLDAAGKSTMLYKMKLGEVVPTIPTIGFNVETVEYKNMSFVCWDIGGQKSIRRLWIHYYQNVNGIIFVIDSGDKERLPQGKEKENEETAQWELQQILNQDQLRGVPLLVFANKQDQSGAMSVQEVATRLGLGKIKDRHWHIQGCSALKGEGLWEGMDWLVSAIQKNPYAVAPAIRL